MIVDIEHMEETINRIRAMLPYVKDFKEVVDRLGGEHSIMYLAYCAAKIAAEDTQK